MVENFQSSMEHNSNITSRGIKLGIHNTLPPKIRADLIILLKATFVFAPPSEGTGGKKFKPGLRRDDIMSAVAKKISSEAQYHALIVNLKTPNISIPEWPFDNAQECKNYIFNCKHLYTIIYHVLCHDLNCTVYRSRQEGRNIRTLVGLNVRVPSSTDGPADALNK